MNAAVPTKKILAVLEDSYGKNPMTEGLAKSLAEKWPDYVLDARHSFNEETLERLVTSHVWMWFSGGDTARVTAVNLIRIMQDA